MVFCYNQIVQIEKRAQTALDLIVHYMCDSILPQHVGEIYHIPVLESLGLVMKN